MLQLSDTTLRDGAQAEGITFSLDDKKQIVRALDELGVAWIEAGNPGANPLDEALFESLRQEPPLRHAHLTAFGSTRRPGIRPEEDEALVTLGCCVADAKTIFGKTSLFHAERVLRCGGEENLRMIQSSIQYLKRTGCPVWYDAEHFFDAWKENRAYALSTLHAAVDGGADRVILCDTNGGSMPEEIEQAVREVAQSLSIPLGIHCHNDCGLATANSLAGVRGGCDLVQGTIGGIGERCGNADLCTLIPLLELKLKCLTLPEGCLPRLTHLSRVIFEIMNIVPNENAPFVGYSAFAHKGGMHIDAILKDPSSYEQIDPESVGNQRRFLLSDQSGRAGIYARLGKLLPDLNRDSAEFLSVVTRLKEQEAKGYTYENADGSFELLALDTLGRRPVFFRVVNYHVLCHQPYDVQQAMIPSAQAYLKVQVRGREGINAAEGNGPVNALDIALRKTLSVFYPSVGKMRLKDFKVRVLNAVGTASLVRVSIESTDGVHIWNTVGVSEDIIEASLRALIDSVDYLLTRYVSPEEIRSASEEE